MQETTRHDGITHPDTLAHNKSQKAKRRCLPRSGIEHEITSATSLHATIAPRETEGTLRLLKRIVVMKL